MSKADRASTFRALNWIVTALAIGGTLFGLLGVTFRDVWPEPVQSAIDWVKAPMSMAWGLFLTMIAVVIALTYVVTAYLLSRSTRAQQDAAITSVDAMWTPTARDKEVFRQFLVDLPAQGGVMTWVRSWFNLKDIDDEQQAALETWLDQWGEDRTLRFSGDELNPRIDAIFAAVGDLLTKLALIVDPGWYLSSDPDQDKTSEEVEAEFKAASASARAAQTKVRDTYNDFIDISRNLGLLD